MSKALVLTVFLRVRGWLGGACDTQSSEQKLQPVQTRTKKGNLSSTKRVAILESDAWNDPSLVPLCLQPRNLTSK